MPKQIVDGVVGDPDIPVEGAQRTPFQIIFESGSELFPNLFTQNTEPIKKWVDAGCDPSRDVLPLIQHAAAKGTRVKTWQYFNQAIMDAKATRETPLPKGTPHANHLRASYPSQSDRAKDAVVRGLISVAADFEGAP